MPTGSVVITYQITAPNATEYSAWLAWLTAATLANMIPGSTPTQSNSSQQRRITLTFPAQNLTT